VVKAGLLVRELERKPVASGGLVDGIFKYKGVFNFMNSEFMPKGLKGFQTGHIVPESIRTKIRKKNKGKHFSLNTEIKAGEKKALGVQRSVKFKKKII